MTEIETIDTKTVLGRPAGMVDLDQNDMIIRNYIFDIAKKELMLRDAVQIETPVMELYSTVESLYGDEFNKLVYTLNDDGNKLIMRYDMTVPLARYVGMNGLLKFRRFQYGKVYRKDAPQISKGRLREFYQFDYDIVGDDQHSGMNDLEMLETLNTILSNILGKNTFTIKFNYRNIVTTILTHSEIPKELFKQVFSAIDKLDKKSWDDIVSELYEKGLNKEMVEKLGYLYSCFNIGLKQVDEQLKILQDTIDLDSNTKHCLNTIILFFSRMNLTNFKLDPFLVRGMDYYTGLLFEVTYNDSKIIESTIAAGGRYDDMIGEFSNKASSIPAIGMSLGIERIAKILEQTWPKSKTKKRCPDIYIASIGENMIVERVALCSELRNMGYYAVMSDLLNPKMRSQFTSVFEEYGDTIPVMVCIGNKEIMDGMLTIKNVKLSIQKTLKKDDALEFIRDILSCSA